MIAHISRMGRDVDKRKTAFTTTIDYTSNAANLGSQTIKFCCLISNHALQLCACYTCIW